MVAQSEPLEKLINTESKSSKAKYSIFLGSFGKSIYNQKNIIKDLEDDLRSAKKMYSSCLSSLISLLNSLVTATGADSEEVKKYSDQVFDIDEQSVELDNFIGVKATIEALRTLLNDAKLSATEEMKSLSDEIDQMNNNLYGYLTETSKDYGSENNNIIDWYLYQYDNSKESYNEILMKISSTYDDIGKITASTRDAYVANSSQVRRISSLSSQIRQSLDKLTDLVNNTISTNSTSI